MRWSCCGQESAQALVTVLQRAAGLPGPLTACGALMARWKRGIRPTALRTAAINASADGVGTPTGQNGLEINHATVDFTGGILSWRMTFR